MTCPNCERLEAENKDLRERLSGTWNQKDLLELNKDLNIEKTRLKDENEKLWSVAEAARTLLELMDDSHTLHAFSLMDLDDALQELPSTEEQGK